MRMIPPPASRIVAVLGALAMVTGCDASPGEVADGVFTRDSEEDATAHVGDGAEGLP